MYVADMSLEEALEWREELTIQLGAASPSRREQIRWDLADVENRIEELKAQ